MANKIKQINLSDTVYDLSLPSTAEESITSLSAPVITTGTASTSYFQSQKFRGEGDASTYYHAVDFGYSGHNSVDFYEYGGIYNFWRNQAATAMTDTANRVASLQLGKLLERGYTLTYPGKSGTFALLSDLTSKQDSLSEAQLNACNSGITATKVNTYDGYATTISGKQAALSTAQLNACNSGITSSKVSTYDGYATTIASKANASALGTQVTYSYSSGTLTITTK